jgi:uncharacterized OB-fold protein
VGYRESLQVYTGVLKVCPECKKVVPPTNCCIRCGHVLSKRLKTLQELVEEEKKNNE